MKLIIIGAGGFGLEVAAYAADCGMAVQGFLDDSKAPGTLHGGHQVLGPIAPGAADGMHYIIALGQPQARRTVAQRMTGAAWATLVHPRAYVAPGASLGPGAIAAPFAFIGPAASLGAHALVNIHASVGHEARLGAYAALCPYANLHGGAAADEAAFLGAGAQALRGATIGAGAKLAAGAVAYNNIPPGHTALGNPARHRAE